MPGYIALGDLTGCYSALSGATGSHARRAEVLAQHVANAIQRTIRRGWDFDKGGNGSAKKIDGLIALTMAYDRSQHRPPAAAFLGWI